MQANESEMNPAADTDAANIAREAKAVIGASVRIAGDITGREDIIINGSVEGGVDFRDNDVLLGEESQVNANVSARNICVAGNIKGELRAVEKIIIMPSGRVDGDLHAPRVILNDGCQFKGFVDMGENKMAGAPPGVAPGTAPPGVAPGVKPPAAKPLGPKPAGSIVPRKG